jgi:hypothetical protein
MTLLRGIGEGGDDDGVRVREDAGKAVQVDPIKSTLKTPGCKRLKVWYDKLLSTFAFKFDMRR